MWQRVSLILTGFILFSLIGGAATVSKTTETVVGASTPTVFIPDTVEGDSIPVRGYVRRTDGTTGLAFLKLDGDGKGRADVGPNGYFEAFLPADPGIHTVTVTGVGYRFEHTVTVTPATGREQEQQGAVAWSPPRHHVTDPGANQSIALTIPVSNTGVDAVDVTVVADGFIQGIDLLTVPGNSTAALNYGGETLPADVDQAHVSFTLYVDGVEQDTVNTTIRKAAADKGNVTGAVENETGTPQAGEERGTLEQVRDVTRENAAWLLLVTVVLAVGVAVYHRLHKQPVRSRQHS